MGEGAAWPLPLHLVTTSHPLEPSRRGDESTCRRDEPTPSTRPIPDLVVISATAPQRRRTAKAELAERARVVPLALAGAGASGVLADSVGATLIDGDPVTAAERIAAERP